MEEKVAYVLNLIQEDGDSFARRAEMYYKKRPELISFVEDSYRAFRALAERYDHLSTELQNANTTIASMFPDQVPFDMDEDDEFGGPPKMPKNFLQPPAPNAPNIPKFPKVPTKDLKGLLTTASKKLQGKKTSKTDNSNHVAPKSGLSKEEALEEIDKLQKEILALQTVKEFVKSSYETGLAKYWGIENQIMEMQQRVSRLQDEFGVGSLIEDDEARTLMAEAALTSCQETLAQLQEKQDKSTKDAKVEHVRIEDARQKLESLKHEFLPDQVDEGKSKKEVVIKDGEKSQSLNQEKKELTIDERDSKKFFTMTELAEKIDQLVTKVISLESSVSSQTALIERLRTEMDDLQSQIKTLEEGKATLINGTHNLNNRLKEMEAKLNGVQHLNQDVEDQNTNLQTHFTQARSSLDHLSKKLQSVKPEVVIEDQEKLLVEAKSQQEKQKDISPSDGENSNTSKTSSLQHQRESVVEAKSQQEEKQKDIPCLDGDLKIHNTSNTEKVDDKKEKGVNISLSKDQTEEGIEVHDKSEKCEVLIPEDKVTKQDFSQMEESLLKIESKDGETDEAEDLNWQQMLLSGVEDREKILLTEYTTILRNYKDLKKKLSDIEKQNQGSIFKLTVQVRDLRSAVSRRDQEIHSLRQKLNLLHGSMGENQDFKLEDWQVPSAEKDDDDDIKVIMADEQQNVSVVEEKLRMDIDAILDENLDFWLRFSTAFHQVQKFRTGVDDLQAEIAELKLKKKKDTEGKTNTSMFTTDIKSDVRPLYKHLREIRTELTVWLEQSVQLKDELQRRLTSLGNIQQEITMALREGVEEEEIKFTSHQAAKFQGEILNMQQENNKVNEELQAGLDHVSALQLETEKTLLRLEEEFELNESNNRSQAQLGNSPSRNRIPLRSFIFGVKAKKQKQSIFACMHHHRKFDSKSGLSL